MRLKPPNPHKVRVSHRIMAKTMQMLLKGTVTAHQLSTHTGVHLVTAQGWLRALHFDKVLYICGWEQDSLGRDATPVYRLGSDTDQKRFSLTRAETQRRYRERLKAKKEQAT